MKGLMQKGLFAGAALVSAVALEISHSPGVLIQDAEARIGRPLTPVSVAGVARRTTRRTVARSRAYVAVLPAGCQTVIVEGVSLSQCGGTYYQASGNQYVIVNVN